MNKDITLYLAYGSNTNLVQMRKRCPTARLVGKTKLKDYQLLFRGINGNAVATVEPKNGSTVPVVIWELQPNDEIALDQYEGVPYLYRKVTRQVIVHGEWKDAMLYLMNNGRPLALPGQRYLGIILEGYEQADFDPRVIKEALAASFKKE